MSRGTPTSAQTFAIRSAALLVSFLYMSIRLDD
jgi:hypothetical protein